MTALSRRPKDRTVTTAAVTRASVTNVLPAGTMRRSQRAETIWRRCYYAGAFSGATLIILMMTCIPFQNYEQAARYFTLTLMVMALMASLALIKKGYTVYIQRSFTLKNIAILIGLGVLTIYAVSCALTQYSS